MAVLVLLQGGQAVPHELDSEEILIGRHPDCGIQLESNAVSRRHARSLSRRGGTRSRTLAVATERLSTVRVSRL